MKLVEGHTLGQIESMILTVCTLKWTNPYSSNSSSGEAGVDRQTRDKHREQTNHITGIHLGRQRNKGVVQAMGVN